MKRLKLYHHRDNPLFFFDDPTGDKDKRISSYHNMNLFALIEKNKWEFVDNIEEADVVPIHMTYMSNGDPNTHHHYSWFKDYLKPHQVAMFMHLYNCDSHQTPNWYRNSDWHAIRNCHDRVVIVHTNNHDDCIDPKYIFHDIMFNRQKYYMFDEVDEEVVFTNGFYWTAHANKKVYAVNDLNKDQGFVNKKFLCPNRIYTFGDHFKKHREVRSKFAEQIQKLDSVYTSDPNIGSFLFPNGWSEKMAESIRVTKTSGTWYPIGDFYYNSSYISAYVESSIDATDESGTYCVSEKTYDPLVKGNFILPFSNQNFVKNLIKYYGFKFPNWIDYSYEEHKDVDKRLEAFFQELHRLNKLSLDTIHNYYMQGRDILVHNRMIIKNRNYDSLHDKVYQSMINLNWV